MADDYDGVYHVNSVRWPPRERGTGQIETNDQEFLNWQVAATAVLFIRMVIRPL